MVFSSRLNQEVEGEETEETEESDGSDRSDGSDGGDNRTIAPAQNIWLWGFLDCANRTEILR